MLVRWVVSAFVLVACWNMVLIANDDNIGRFTALHSRYGAYLGLEEGAILEEYAKELFFGYHRFEMNGGLDAQFRPENIPYYWVHAVLGGELPSRLVQQATAFLRDGKPATNEETIAAFILLDKVNLKETVIDIWSDENSQMQFDVFERLIGGGDRYASFSGRLVSALDEQAQVGRQVTPDSGFSVPFRFVLDCYFLDLIRSNHARFQELDGLISTEYLHLVAKAVNGSISDNVLSTVQDEFLAGKHDEHLGCAFRFDFALTEKFAKDLLRVRFSECRIDRYRGLGTISLRYPLLANQVLGSLSTSDKQEDLRVVLKFFGGPTFRRLDNLPVVVDALTSHLEATNADYLTGVRQWPITCAAFSEIDGGVEVSLSVKRTISPSKLSKLESICEDINRRCPLTFFARSLEDAILSIKAR